jgi:hypothetical protein
VKFFVIHHLVENTPDESPDPSPGPRPHVPRLVKARLKTSLGDGRGLEDPAGMTIFEGLYRSQHNPLNLKSWLPYATEDDVSLVSEALLSLA